MAWHETVFLLLAVVESTLDVKPTQRVAMFTKNETGGDWCRKVHIISRRDFDSVLSFSLLYYTVCACKQHVKCDILLEGIQLCVKARSYKKRSLKMKWEGIEQTRFPFNASLYCTTQSVHANDM